MKQLLKIWDADDLLDRIIEQGEAGVAEAARPFTIAGLAGKRPVTLVITPRSRDAEALAVALEAWIDPGDIAVFPAWEVVPGEALSPSLEVMGRRICIARNLRLQRQRTQASGARKPPRIIVASMRALLQRMADPGEDAVDLHRGGRADLEELTGTLVSFGYDRNYLVESPGEFSVRGGILDVFPPSLAQPVRIDLFGDEISDIRSFSVSSQRSGKQQREVEIAPCRELRLTVETAARAERLGREVSGGDDRQTDLARLAEGLAFPGMESYLALVQGPLVALTDLLPGEALVVIADPKQCLDRAGDFLAQAAEWGGDLSEGMFADPPSILRAAEPVALWSYARGAQGIDLQVRGWDDFSGRVEKLAGELSRLRKHEATVAVAAGKMASRAAEVLSEAGLGLPVEEPRVGAASITRTSVLKGFLLSFSDKPALALVGEADLFGKRRQVAARAAEAEGEPPRVSALLLQLAEGDYVVHETYGVGRYHGMVTREVAGISRDYLLIEYHGEDRLYLPTEQLEAITKYTGGEAPKLNRLGTGEWEKAKSRARRAVADIAGELIVLYSKRQHAEGHAFSPDTPWQTQLEDSFEHIETPDQLTAIDDVKRDMEKARPMDRLVCGDVGYGKTEVAVRAAFKAVQDSKQVAVLVPTTILAQQHYQTFAERFAGFPVKVAQLSRFLSDAEASKVLEGVAAGKVDVVIGTHRLLQNDVKFHDLGLLVIDEEHRLGVKHKEKIKKLKEHVDVLTMTATPIPRTLEMGLTGIRDLSLMDTPPAERQPVTTYVGEADDRMIAAAIRRELARDGQVFYVHNRVSSIKGAARKIGALVPGARVAVAHGQMNETELEAAMMDVWDGKIDVLVCTTIIESGLDIPSMNTLIVERADRLGLAQLYQLRGRVGRARERAYAYFLYPHEAVLTDEAHERLKTLSAFTELGSGFKIALRDLEIRGAGNLLGAQQSGHIAAVGFDLYMRMMSEAIADLAQEPLEPKVEVKLDLPADAFIPASYIARESLRMEAYRQIEKIRSPEDAVRLREELADRFGPIPDPVENLLLIGELRGLMAGYGIQEAGIRNGVLKVKPLPALSESQELLLRARYKGADYRSGSGVLLLPAPAGDVPKWALSTLNAILAHNA